MKNTQDLITLIFLHKEDKRSLTDALSSLCEKLSSHDPASQKTRARMSIIAALGHGYLEKEDNEPRCTRDPREIEA